MRLPPTCESIPLLKARFLHTLVLGQLSRDVIDRRTKDLHWDNLDGWYQVVLIHVPSRWDELNRLSFSEQTSQMLEHSDELFVDSQENIVLLLQGRERPLLEERTRSLAP